MRVMPQAQNEEIKHLDFNANAAPTCLPKEDVFTPEKLKNLSEDFAFAKNLALLKLKSQPAMDMPAPVSPYYVQNDDGTEEPSSSEGGCETIYAPLSTDGGSNNGEVQGGSGSGVETEKMAMVAAEEFLNEAEAKANELCNGNWEIEDETGYKYVDPQYYVDFKELMAILDVIALLGMIIDAIRAIKKMMIQLGLMKDSGNSSEDLSASETLGSARESGMLLGQGQMLELSESVYTWNQALLQEKSNKAKKQAESEARSFGTYLHEIWTSGTSDLIQRKSDKIYTEKMHSIMEDYSDFNEEVMHKYETVLSQSKLYKDDMTEMTSIFNSLSSFNLVVDIGSGKVDIDRTRIMKSQLRMSSFENSRRVYVMYRTALQKLKSLVIEIWTGHSCSPKVKELMQGLLDSLERFENMAFSTMAQQLQATIYSHNTEVDMEFAEKKADYLYHSALWSGIFSSLLCGITRNLTDWISLESLYDDGTNKTNPNQLDMQSINSMIYDIYGNFGTQINESFKQSSCYANELNQLERQEWQIIGRLTENGVTYVAGDGYKGIDESKVNALREELVKIQNKERILIMGVEAQQKLIQIILKLLMKTGEIGSAKDAKSAGNIGIQGRLLTFDMKFSGIKNKVDEFNTQQKIKEEREKLQAVGIGSIIGLVVAVILIIIAAYTGGASIPLVIGLISSFGQLGAALGNIIYNASNPIDDSLYEQTAFYDQLEKSQDRRDRQMNEELDRINENAHVDAEDNSDPLSAGNMWATDTKLFMEVRDQLVQIYLAEQITNMYVKALSDSTTMVVASFIGAWTGSEYEEARSASSARLEQKVKAFGLKQDMVKDYISKRNMSIQQETDQNWAILQACISAVSAACSAVGAAGGSNISTTAQTALEWVSWAAEIASQAAQAARSLFEAMSEYDELGEFERIQKMIDVLLDHSFYKEGNAILREALSSINESDMLESVSGGKVIVDASVYYQEMRAIQLMYNKVILMFKVSEAIARIKARVAQAPVPYGASEAYQAAKDNYIQQLNLLKERVDAYAERYNAIVDAWKQFTIATVMVVFMVAMKILQKTGSINKFKAWIKDKIGSKQWKITDDPQKSKTLRFFIEFFTGKDNHWDGTLGTADIVNFVLIDLILNPQTIKYITKKIFDKANEGDREAKATNQVLTNRSGSTVEQLENDAYNNQLRAAALENTFSKMEINWQSSMEDTQFVISSFDTLLKSTIDDSWQMATDIIRLSKKAAIEGNKVFMPLELAQEVMKVKMEQLDEIDWKNQQDVQNKLAQAQLAIAAKAKDEQERAVMVYAAANAAADTIIVQNAAEQAVSVSNLEKTASGSDVDPNTARFALAVLSHVAKRNPAPENQAAQERAVSAVAVQEMLVSETPVIEKIDLNTQRINWQAKTPEEFANQQPIKDLMALLESETESENLSINPDRQDMLAYAASAAASQLPIDPAQRQKALENLSTVANDGSKPQLLRDYAQMVLDAASVEKPEGSKDAQATETQTTRLINRIYIRSKAIERLAEQGRTEEAQKQFALLKQDAFSLVRIQDTRALGIDLGQAKTRITNCQTMGEAANAIDEYLVNNENFKVVAKDHGIKLLKDSGDILRNAEQILIKAQGTVKTSETKEAANRAYYTSTVLAEMFVKNGTGMKEFANTLRKKDHNIDTAKSDMAQGAEDAADPEERVFASSQSDFNNDDQGHQGNNKQKQEMAWANGLSKNAELIRKHNGNGNGGLA